MSIIKQHRQVGFSLIEVLVAMTIIAILAVAIIPNLWNRVSEAKEIRVTSDMKSIETALNIYRLDNGNFPNTAQGLKALVQKPTTPPIPSDWNGPYLDQIPKDPWQNAYNYTFPGTHGNQYDLYSYGEGGDAQANTTIGNWSVDTE